MSSISWHCFRADRSSWIPRRKVPGGWSINLVVKMLKITTKFRKMKFTTLLFALSALVMSSLAAPVPQITYIGLDVPDDAAEICKLPNGEVGPASRHKRDGTMEFDVDLCILKKRAARVN
ncbi:hypothetical protein QBC41DRAFT_7687 [Cercophora samala]|uniref:Uncharacterized protein n=1 Tax=Cercophora samala TaxID=330535 RepID=A0AA39ZKS1_9PEZI|nr:hypothetical protein QBC41DRAFT_7687 [Cercophora samala]